MAHDGKKSYTAHETGRIDRGKGVFGMQIDKATLEKLLTLNDGQLKFIMGRIAGEHGIDLSGLNINMSDMSSVRNAIRNISDSQLAAISAQIEAAQRASKRNGR